MPHQSDVTTCQAPGSCWHTANPEHTQCKKEIKRHLCTSQAPRDMVGAYSSIVAQEALPSYMTLCQVTAASPIKNWSLSPLLLKLGWPVACFDQWNVMKVSLCDFPRSGVHQLYNFCFLSFWNPETNTLWKSPASLVEQEPQGGELRYSATVRTSRPRRATDRPPASL